jgi:CheY-like chemotaxis protein
VTDLVTNNKLLSILIVDADERVRESLAGLLEIGQRCVVVACAGNSAEALELLDRSRPDVVLLDPRLPELDTGRALVRAITERRPATRIVVLGAADALDEAGFAGISHSYVRKTFRPKELLDAVAAATGLAGQPVAGRPGTERRQPW